MDSITAQLTIRDSLRTNLADPYTLYSPAVASRTGEYWIFADEPNAGNKHPKIEVLKANDSINSIIAMGAPYADFEYNFFNVFFYSKNGTSIVVDGVTYKNAQVVEYYLGLIKSTIKSQFNTITSADGIKDIVPVATSKSEYDPATQLYYGYVTFRVRHFNLSC